MDLRNRWVIARQTPETTWEFFADRGPVWSPDFYRAILFQSLWGAEEALMFSAGGQGTVREAADVASFAITGKLMEADTQTS